MGSMPVSSVCYTTRSHVCAEPLHVAEEPAEFTSQVRSSQTEGELLRVAMQLVHGARVSSNDAKASRSRLKRFCSKAVGHDVAPDGTVWRDDELASRLKQMARQTDRDLATQLDLLVRFADAELYTADGCRSMVHWMDVWLGLGRIAASERLRVGRALRELPVCASLFALGQLSWTQVRVITRHATPSTDESMAAACVDLSASETEVWCTRFQHETDGASITAAEDSDAQAALLAHERRALRVHDIDDQRVRITLELPKDLASEFLRSLDQCDDELVDESRNRPEQDADSKASFVQRRADAAVLMSRRSISHAGPSVSMADRYRVHVMMDAATLDPDACSKRRPVIDGQRPISRAMACRLAQQAGYTTYAVDAEGDPVGTKQRHAPFSRRQLKALRARDGCCQMPGCGATRHLDGHHIVPRAQGGESTFDNAVLLCSGCHRLLHEGGFRVERIPAAQRGVRRYRLFNATGDEVCKAPARAGLFPRGNRSGESPTAGSCELTPISNAGLIAEGLSVVPPQVCAT